MAQHNVTLGEIGRIIGSSLETDEVYERFAEQVHKLISFDRISVALINPDHETFICLYVTGVEGAGSEGGESLPIAGTAVEEVVRTKSGILFQSGGGAKATALFSVEPFAAESGMKSILVTPLISNDTIIGSLHLHSVEHSTYTEADLALAERVAAQIADAIANAQLFAERQALEERLLRSQRMEAIGRLAGGMAHDFNNLLTPILSYVDLSAQALPEHSEILDYLREIRKAAERASSLTRQLLAFSRHQVIEPQVINLNELIINMDMMLRRLINENIELVTLPSSNLGLVRVDPGLVEQVLVNLVVNARDAMAYGGKLVIRSANVTVEEEDRCQQPELVSGNYVMLAVTDTGIGMREDVKAHIFEPFFTTKAVGKGTGLGLSTCYGIVAQSGGQLTADSTPGHGTVFRVYLPRVPEGSDVRPLPQDEANKPEGHETVLLVEDEPLVREVASQVLRKQGYKVLEAANGHEALEVAADYGDEEIHLLLTDVVMPLMGGRELSENLKLKRSNMKVLYTSGYTDDAIVQYGIDARGAEFLQKPFTPTVLARRVREVLEG